MANIKFLTGSKAKIDSEMSIGSIDAGDVILVMDRNKDQDIKHLLSNLCKEDKYKKYL